MLPFYFQFEITFDGARSFAMQNNLLVITSRNDWVTFVQ